MKQYKTETYKQYWIRWKLALAEVQQSGKEPDEQSMAFQFLHGIHPKYKEDVNIFLTTKSLQQSDALTLNEVKDWFLHCDECNRSRKRE